MNYCPRCGGNVFNHNMRSSSQMMSCVYCNKPIFVSDGCGGTREESLPIKNKKKALELRKKYDKDPEKKKQGEENLRERKQRRKEERIEGAKMGARARKVLRS